MTKLGILIATASLLLACSSSSKKQAARPEDPTIDPAATEAPSEMAKTEGTDPSWDPSAAATAGSDDAMGSGMAAAEPAPPPEEPPAPTAMANLVSMKDSSAVGTVTFEQEGNTITMSGTFTGLPPGPHAFYIHEKGDCTKKGRSIGKHLDPTKAKHGPPSSGTRHAGDLGNIVADKDGNATFEMATDSVVMEEGRADSILRRSIVIHAKKDDTKGRVNAPIACGVIEMAGGDEARSASDASATGAGATPTETVQQK